MDKLEVCQAYVYVYALTYIRRRCIVFFVTSPYPDSIGNPLYHVARHPVRLVVERTGLTAHTLRAWERRYQVVNPSRSDGGQRLYSDRDVEHLRLLHQATEAGRNIGQVSTLSLPALRDLVAQDQSAGPAVPADVPSAGAAQALDTALGAVEALDGAALEAMLRRSAMALSVPVLLDDVVAPLLREIGERWRAGRLEPAFEHLATTAVQSTLSSMIGSADPPADAPVLLVATPSEQRHELGALMAATAAAAEGWRIVYLGPDLPAGDIVTAARRTGAAMIALSVVFPAVDPALIRDIGAVRSALPAIPLIVGGRAALAATESLRAAGAVVAGDLNAFRPHLRRHVA